MSDLSNEPVRPSRLLVTGSRSFTDAELMTESLLDAMNDYCLGLEVVVVHGNAPGADRIAAAAARKLGLAVEPHDADWDGPCRATCKPGHRRPAPRSAGTYCPAAGTYRNQDMVDMGADLLIAFPLGKSAGTRDAIQRARAAGIPVRVFEDRQKNV